MMLGNEQGTYEMNGDEEKARLGDAPSSKPTVATLTDSRLAALCAERLQVAFLEYQRCFRSIGQRARQRFLQRDWPGSFADASERLHLYSQQLDLLVISVSALMGPRLEDRKIWMAIKAVYSASIAQYSEWEIAESFFNSLTRRVFATEGVDQAIEFVDSDFDAPPAVLPQPEISLNCGPLLSELLTSALTSSAAGGFSLDLWHNFESRLQQACERVQAALPEGVGDLSLEMISVAFFRGRGAYLVGRVWRQGEESSALPLALCLRHPSEAGITLDAVLLGELPLSVLFSYTRAYFRVVTTCPYSLVRQLRGLMPHKPLVDLYTGLGFQRHGKTELYRDFVAHMRRTDQKFVTAEGTRGMVMLVFTLPTYDVVFKLIKDRFDYPKNTSPSDVKRSYRLVFEHDRAGRLVEAHEFEHLRIPKSRFDDGLLEQLLRQAADTVKVEGRYVLISHAYVERRVRPLNLYLAEEEQDASTAAALDYGQAIKDLAASNIFAGDIFTKNFGVTRTKRVVFYDYDELCYLTECNFRAMPQPTTPEQEMAAEPWFSVRENDIFPEEFPRFLGLPEHARSAFHAKHGDLFQPDFWRGLQARFQQGDIPEIFPYDDSCRLE